MAASEVEPGATRETRVELSVELILTGPGQSLVGNGNMELGKVQQGEE